MFCVPSQQRQPLKNKTSLISTQKLLYYFIQYSILRDELHSVHFHFNSKLNTSFIIIDIYRYLKRRVCKRN
jgi:hypothetical protein